MPPETQEAVRQFADMIEKYNEMNSRQSLVFREAYYKKQFLRSYCTFIMHNIDRSFQVFLTNLTYYRDLQTAEREFKQLGPIARNHPYVEIII